MFLRCSLHRKRGVTAFREINIHFAQGWCVGWAAVGEVVRALVNWLGHDDEETRSLQKAFRVWLAHNGIANDR
jgi:hypothetical protein